jgi:sugar/nucleoside kinase (ribokinase family)
MEFDIEIPVGKRFDAVALGLNAIDHLIVVPHYPEFNTKVPYVSHTLAPGGQCATAMVTLARLGLRASYIGKVGSDEMGRAQIDSIAAEGVERSAVSVVEGAETQTAFIIVDEQNLKHRVYPALRQRQSILLNRDIIRLFSTLRVSDSFLLQNNLREILFRKPVWEGQK